MKLISLNTWSGRAGKENLWDFFHKHKDVDIFCLQEVWEGGHEYSHEWEEGIDTVLFTNISNILKEHSAFFRPHHMDHYGLAIFAKKNLKIIEEGDIFVFKEKEDVFEKVSENHARNLQYVNIETPGGLRTIINFHGLWNGLGKEDTDERLKQSDNIITFLKKISNPHILTGDFNLLPETKSLKKLEEIGLINLIKKFKITSTRSSHYKKSVRFADYILVSNEIRINEFKILPDKISDHLAMYLDFQ